MIRQAKAGGHGRKRSARATAANWAAAVAVARLLATAGDLWAAPAIDVTGVGSWNDLDLTTNSTNLHTANVRETNDDPGGYSVTLTSANAGKLANGADNITYTATYNATSIPLSGSPQLITTGGAAIADIVKAFRISFTGVVPEDRLAGTYADSLSFTIRDSSGTPVMSDSITLQGVVPATTATIVSGVGPYNALDLGSNATNLHVTNVREIDNTPNGYQLTLTSLNGGRLKNGSTEIPYSATYNSSGVTLSQTPVIITNQAPGSPRNVVKPFRISYGALTPGSVPAGTYSDTLTFAISQPSMGPFQEGLGGPSLLALTGSITIQGTIIGTERFWQSAAGGSWHTAANWAPSSVPTAGNEAVFNLPDTYTVTLAAAASARELRSGGGDATLDLGGQTLTVAGRVGVGVTSGVPGVLRINNGTVSATAAGVHVHAIGDVAAGAGGASRLHVGAGGVLSLGGGDRLDIGAVSSSTGELHVTDGGDVVFAPGSNGIRVGVLGSGAMTVSGAGSSVFVPGAGSDLAVGEAGVSVGTLNISDGATVNVGGALRVRDVGAASPGGTRVNFSGGTLTVGTLDTSGNPSRFNWTGGTLHLTQPSNVLEIATPGPLGQNLDLIAGRTLIADGGVRVGGSGTPGAHNGGLEVQAGGSFNAAFLHIGMVGAGTGTVIFGGTTAQPTISTLAGNLRIGDNGSPSSIARIDAHATVSVAGASQVYALGQLHLNGGTLSTASLDTGGNSNRFNWTSGTLNITGVNQATVLQTGGNLGNPVIGAGMTLNVADTIRVADVNNGALYVNPGGTVSAGDVQVALVGTGNAGLIMTGSAGSPATMNVTRWLDVSNNGVNGTFVEINPHATLTVGSRTKIWSNSGLVTLQGGTLRTGEIDTGGVPSRFSWTSGTLELGGALRIHNSSDGPLGHNVAIDAQKTLRLFGTNALRVGQNNPGMLVQTGGRVENAQGRLEIGFAPGGDGVYNISGGTLYTNQLSVGGSVTSAGGIGELNISGTADVTVLDAFIIHNTGSPAPNGTRVDFSGGSLTVPSIHVSAFQRFAWTGGTLTIDDSALVVGTGSLAPLGNAPTIGTGKTLRLIDRPGGFESGAIYVNPASTFTVAGGAVDARQVQLNGGTVSLSSGNLSVALETLLSGQTQFNQTGGTHITPRLATSGTYTLAGGTLNISAGGGLDSSGTWNSGGGSGATLNATAGAVVDFSTGTFSNTGSLSINGSPNTLVIFPAGFNPATQLAAYNNPGVTGFAGGATIPAGYSIIGGGVTVDAPLHVEGSITQSAIKQLFLSNGLTVAAGGSVDVFGVGVNGPGSGIVAGGTLTADGLGSNGTFTQSGGTVTLGTLGVYSEPAPNGRYELAGGILTTGQTEIGYTDVFIPGGTFAQTGGTHSAQYVSVTVGGVYDISGGNLSAATYLGVGSGGGLHVRGSANVVAETLGVWHTTTYAQSGGVANVGEVEGTGTAHVSGGTLTLDRLNDLGALTISDAGTVAVRPQAGDVHLVNTIAVTDGGRLDLADSALVIRAGVHTLGVGSATGGVYSGVTGLIQRAHNGGAWDGAGITTSMPDATAGLTAIGVAAGGDVGFPGPFGPAPIIVNNDDVLVMYTYAGDANMDGFISGDDYAAIDFNIAVPNSEGWYNGDFNYDGIISGDDYAAIDFNIVAQGAPFPTGGSATMSGAVAPTLTAVPEPHALTVALAALAASPIRRRRRNCRH